MFRSISCFSTHSNAISVARSTGWSKTKGSPGTSERPVTVGPHILSLGFCTFLNSGLEYLTAVWIVNAGRALAQRRRSSETRSYRAECVRRYPGILPQNSGDPYTHIDAMDWNTARLTASIPIRVDSEKLAASIGDGPLLYALYPS